MSFYVVASTDEDGRDSYSVHEDIEGAIEAYQQCRMNDDTHTALIGKIVASTEHY